MIYYGAYIFLGYFGAGKIHSPSLRVTGLCKSCPANYISCEIFKYRSSFMNLFVLYFTKKQKKNFVASLHAKNEKMSVCNIDWKYIFLSVWFIFSDCLLPYLLITSLQRTVCSCRNSKALSVMHFFCS